MSSTHSTSQANSAALPDELRKKIRIAVCAPVIKADRGKRFELEVKLDNHSELAISSDEPQRIYLSYHWVDGEGNYEQYDGLRTALPGVVRAGEQCTVKMIVQAPAKGGLYALQVGLLQEGVSWFEVRDKQHLQTISFRVNDARQPSLKDFKTVARYAEDRPIQVDAPPAIFSFELTNQCPFKCIMCARTNNMTRAEGNMSFATFTKAIDEFVELNPQYALSQEVWLHGFGESLTHPEFGKFMRYATDKGIHAGLSINPLMLTKKVARELLDARPKHLYIALDGHDDASFEKIRGVKNAYRKSKKRLIKFLQEKDARGLDTKITLSMIDFQNNRQSIDKVEKFWEAHEGIDHFIAKPFVTWDGKAEDVNLLLLDTRKPEPVQDKVMCGFPWEKMTVSWDGDLVPCCFDYNKRYSLGNINEQGLAEIWNGAKMHALRTEFKSNKVSNPLCEGCEYLHQEIVADALS